MMHIDSLNKLNYSLANELGKTYRNLEQERHKGKSLKTEEKTLMERIAKIKANKEGEKDESKY